MTHTIDLSSLQPGELCAVLREACKRLTYEATDMEQAIRDMDAAQQDGPTHKEVSAWHRACCRALDSMTYIDPPFSDRSPAPTSTILDLTGIPPGTLYRLCSDITHVLHRIDAGVRQDYAMIEADKVDTLARLTKARQSVHATQKAYA